MREEFKPGDLSARIGFARRYGSGSDSGKVHPNIEITDATSGLHLELQFTAEQLVDMLSGSEAHVPAAKVFGFQGIRNWGKHLHIMTVPVECKPGDFSETDPLKLPHVAQAAAQVEADGYRCGTPRRNNANRWVIVGRKYTDEP